jgi:hypothetical protein
VGVQIQNCDKGVHCTLAYRYKTKQTNSQPVKMSLVSYSLWAGQLQEIGIRISAGTRDFCFVRNVQRSTQSRIQWVPGAVSPGIKLTTHFHLVPRSKMVELYLHSPYDFMASQIVQNSLLVRMPDRQKYRFDSWGSIPNLLRFFCSPPQTTTKLCLY